jgi:hypothetical protein
MKRYRSNTGAEMDSGLLGKHKACHIQKFLTNQTIKIELRALALPDFRCNRFATDLPELNQTTIKNLSHFCIRLIVLAVKGILETGLEFKP